VEKIQPAPDRSNPTPQQIDTLPHIRGIVIDVDGTDKYVLPQAIILLKGQGISTLSDTSGKFELSIPPDYKEENITLEVSLPGYLSKEVAVTRNDTEYVEIRLDINKRTTQYSWVMGAVTTITAIDLTSEPNSWQRFKYKVGHLFR
jgi:hypothetical protein